MSLVWEKVDADIERTRTPGGWLVRQFNDVAHIGADLNNYVTTGYDWRVTLTYVPDPDGVWCAPRRVKCEHCNGSGLHQRSRVLSWGMISPDMPCRHCLGRGTA